MPQRSIDPMLPRLRSLLADEPVAAAYVYGSHARGTADAESDVDLALLAERGLPGKAYWDLRLRVTTKLLGVLRDRSADVVVLQQAPTLLQYNIVRNAIVVLDRDPAARRSFEIAVERRYDDERPYLDRETDIILDRIITSVR